MQKVRAKFQVMSVTEYASGKKVELNAVYGREGENADFTKYTPSGNIVMSLDKDAPAAQAFVPGATCYVTFEEAPN